MSSDDSVTADFTFRPHGSDITVRQVFLGAESLVLIEPELDGDDVVFNVDATGIEASELADVLRVLLAALDQAEAEGRGPT